MLTRTMAKQAGMRKKKDDMGVYTPHTKSKKGGSNIVQQGTEANRSANDDWQAPMTPTHPRPALAVTPTLTKPRRWAPTELITPSTNRRMHTMLLPERRPITSLLQ